MSVPNCEVNREYSYDPLCFGTKIEPTGAVGYEMLNPDAISSQYDPDFYSMKCEPSCGDREVYYSNDPTLISVAHGGDVLMLDRPPINGNVRLKDVYSPKLREYGKTYKDYSDIKAGQILYYIDKSIADPIIEPVFENPASVTGWVYQDPMGSLKPYYCRVPVEHTDVYDTKKYTPGQLTWMRDSLESREDLIALQMDEQNRKKYSARWY